MRQYTLIRSYLPDRTVSVLKEGDEDVCNMLERPNLLNAPSRSCILEGTYVVKRDKSGRHQFYAVQNTPGRTFIEMHAGVVPGHSLGCLLPCYGFNARYDAVDSDKAMDDFLNRQGDESFLLAIRARTWQDGIFQ